MNNKTIFIFVSFLFSISLIFAAGYHLANDIRGGTFKGNFVFTGDVDFTDATITGVSSDGLPVGSIVPLATQIVPVDWKECNGEILNITDYNELYNVIGTTFGGDGITNFSLPDLRGEFIRGFDNGRGVDDSRTLGSFQNHSFQDHKHSLSHNYGQFYKVYTGNWNGKKRPWWNGIVSIEILDPDTGNVANDTKPRNVAMKYIIKIN